MRFLSKILWLAAFLAATFAWVVLFEHGFSVDGFRRGVTVEWQELVERVKSGAASAAADTSEPVESGEPSAP